MIFLLNPDLGSNKFNLKILNLFKIQMQNM